MTVSTELAGMLKDRLSVRELELLCAPGYAPPKNATESTLSGANSAKTIRKILSADLADIFRHGNKHAAKDKWKAHNYDKIATGNKHLPPPGSSWLRSKHVYDKHSIFNQTRLLLVRIGRIFAYFKQTFLPAFFAYFSLSVGLTLLFDIFVILKHTFSEKPKSAKDFFSLRYWRDAAIRCKNAILKDNRPYRLINDIVWFTINLTVLVVTGPLYFILNPILNTIGFGFDLLHEAAWLGIHTLRAHKLMKKLDAEIKLKQQELLNPELTPEARKDKNDAIDALTVMREAMKKQRNSEFKKRLWVVSFFVILFAGMAMLYFPPTTFPGLFLVGSAMALVAGSVFTGLGKRLYGYGMDYGKQFINWVKQKQQSKKHTNDLNFETCHTASTALCISRIKSKQTNPAKQKVDHTLPKVQLAKPKPRFAFSKNAPKKSKAVEASTGYAIQFSR